MGLHRGLWLAGGFWDCLSFVVVRSVDPWAGWCTTLEWPESRVVSDVYWMCGIPRMMYVYVGRQSCNPYTMREGKRSRIAVWFYILRPFVFSDCDGILWLHEECNHGLRPEWCDPVSSSIILLLNLPLELWWDCIEIWGLDLDVKDCTKNEVGLLTVFLL